MNEKLKNNELFKASYLMILISYTIFSGALIAEGLLLGWEKWALFLVFTAVLLGWGIYVNQNIGAYTKLWFISVLISATFFFYGIHETSTFDLAPIMATVIMLDIMTGVPELIKLCLVTYFLTFSYSIATWIVRGKFFDKLIISRTILHAGLIIIVATIAQAIMTRWKSVLEKVGDEIKDLEEGTERIGDFLARVSHEIRTPANAIIGLTEVSLEKEKDEDIKEDMTSVLEAGRRISDQISDILDYSELDRRSIAVNKEDYTLASIIYDVSEQIRPFLKEGCELVINVEPTVPAVMNTDVIKLKRIIHHLLENALKFTIDGGVYMHIYSIKEDYGVNLCIDVEDTGIGMEEDELENALVGFYKADSSRAVSTGGLGLGLPIVSGLVSSLGGFLTIKSRINVGTTVSLSIPQIVVDGSNCMSLRSKETLSCCAFIRFDKFKSPIVREYYARIMMNIVGGLDIKVYRVESVEDLKKLCERVSLTHLMLGREEYECDIPFINSLSRKTLIILTIGEDYYLDPASNIYRLSKPVSSFSVTGFLNMDLSNWKKENEYLRLERVKALVVDDEPLNLTVARGIMGRYGMSIDTALSGKESIEACDNVEYDIVFMDHMMPGMDGIEAAKTIRRRARSRGHRPAIVALTANAVSSAKEMFFSEGFDGFISKPIELSELERVMRRVLPLDKMDFVKADDSQNASLSDGDYRAGQTEIPDLGGLFAKQGGAVSHGTSEAGREGAVRAGAGEAGRGGAVRAGTSEAGRGGAVRAGAGEAGREEMSGNLILPADAAITVQSSGNEKDRIGPDRTSTETNVSGQSSGNKSDRTGLDRTSTETDVSGQSSGNESDRTGLDRTSTETDVSGQSGDIEKDRLDTLSAAGIQTERGLVYCQGDRDFYQIILQEFISEAPEKEEKLKEAFDSNDRKAYRIGVHALKSTAKTIGALDLSDMALELEEIAASDREIPVDKHVLALENYRAVREAIESIQP